MSSHPVDPGGSYLHLVEEFLAFYGTQIFFISPQLTIYSIPTLYFPGIEFNSFLYSMYTLVHILYIFGKKKKFLISQSTYACWKLG
jgi:hypothetical protein